MSFLMPSYHHTLWALHLDTEDTKYLPQGHTWPLQTPEPSRSRLGLVLGSRPRSRKAGLHFDPGLLHQSGGLSPGRTAQDDASYVTWLDNLAHAYPIPHPFAEAHLCTQPARSEEYRWASGTCEAWVPLPGASTARLPPQRKVLSRLDQSRHFPLGLIMSQLHSCWGRQGLRHSCFYDCPLPLCADCSPAVEMPRDKLELLSSIPWAS